MQKSIIGLVVLILVDMSINISFSLDNGRVQQCFTRRIKGKHQIALQFQIIGSSQLKLETIVTQDHNTSLKTRRTTYSSDPPLKTLDYDHDCTVCFTILDKGTLNAINPSVAFHFQQAPLDQQYTDLVHSQQIQATIQRLKATHQKLLYSLFDIQLSLENEEYQQQVYYGVEEQVKKFSYAKIIVALVIFSIQLWVLIKLFKGKQPLQPYIPAV